MGIEEGVKDGQRAAVHPSDVKEVKENRKPPRRYKVEEYALALKKAQGKQSLAAQILGVRPSAVTNRLKKSEYLRNLLKEIWEEWLDIIELDEYQAARKGPPRIRMECRHFILTHHKRSKARGWGKRTEITGAEGGPIDIKIMPLEGGAECPVGFEFDVIKQIEHVASGDDEEDVL